MLTNNGLPVRYIGYQKPRLVAVPLSQVSTQVHMLVAFIRDVCFHYDYVGNAKLSFLVCD